MLQVKSGLLIASLHPLPDGTRSTIFNGQAISACAARLATRNRAVSSQKSGVPIAQCSPLTPDPKKNRFINRSLMVFVRFGLFGRRQIFGGQLFVLNFLWRDWHLGGSSIRIITLLLEDRQVVPILEKRQWRRAGGTQKHINGSSKWSLYMMRIKSYPLSFLKIMITCPIHQPWFQRLIFIRILFFVSRCPFWEVMEDFTPFPGGFSGQTVPLTNTYPDFKFLFLPTDDSWWLQSLQLQKMPDPF